MRKMGREISVKDRGQPREDCQHAFPGLVFVEGRRRATKAVFVTEGR